MSESAKDWAFTVLLLAVAVAVGIYVGRWAHHFLFGGVVGAMAFVIECLLILACKKLYSLMG